MRTKRSNPRDRSVLAVYWLATMVDAVRIGDAIMAGAARRELHQLGLDVDVALRRGCRPSATA